MESLTENRLNVTTSSPIY